MAIGWTDSKLFPEGLILNLLLTGETFNSFQLDGIANLILLVRKYINKFLFGEEKKRREEEIK